jgi:hypothetical protein
MGSTGARPTASSVGDVGTDAGAGVGIMTIGVTRQTMRESGLAATVGARAEEPRGAVSSSGFQSALTRETTRARTARPRTDAAPEERAATASPQPRSEEPRARRDVDAAGPERDDAAGARPHRTTETRAKAAPRRPVETAREGSVTDDSSPPESCAAEAETQTEADSESTTRADAEPMAWIASSLPSMAPQPPSSRMRPEGLFGEGDGRGATPDGRTAMARAKGSPGFAGPGRAGSRHGGLGTQDDAPHDEPTDGAAALGEGVDAKVLSERIEDAIRGLQRRGPEARRIAEQGPSEEPMREGSAAVEPPGATPAERAEGTGATPTPGAKASPQAASGAVDPAGLGLTSVNPKTGRASGAMGGGVRSELLTRELETLVRARRQEAATSAVNHLTLRHGAEGRVDLDELGTVTVSARSDGGEIDVSIRASNEDTAALLQSTSAFLEGDLRRDSLEIRHLSVEHERQERRDGEGAGRDHRARDEASDEPTDPVPPPAEDDFESSVRFVLQDLEALPAR